MPHRCVAGGCSNTGKCSVSLHGWPLSHYYSRLWTNAVKNTRANFTLTNSSKLCSDHFDEDAYEPNAVIAQSLGLKLKRTLKADAVPTIFVRSNSKEKQNQSAEVPEKDVEKPARAAFRKRESARI